MDLLWARILVLVDDRKLPREMEVKMERKSWRVQLWWEFPPIFYDLSVVLAQKDEVLGGEREKTKSSHAPPVT